MSVEQKLLSTREREQQMPSPRKRFKQLPRHRLVPPSVYAYGRFTYEHPARLWVRLDQELISKGQNPSRPRQLPGKFDPKDASS